MWRVSNTVADPSLARRDVDPADLAAFITAIFDGLANTIAATGGAAANTIAATGGAVANGLGGDTTTTTDTNATVAARSLGEDMGTTLGENVGKAIAEDLKRAVAGRLNGDA